MDSIIVPFWKWIILTIQLGCAYCNVLTCLLSAEAPRHLTAAPGKGSWPGLPETELKLIWAGTTSEEPTDIKSSKKKLVVASPRGGKEESSHAPPTEGVCSKKQSAVHEAVIKSRDETFQVGCWYSGCAHDNRSQTFQIKNALCLAICLITICPDNVWSQTFPIKNALCLAICLIVQTICPDNVKHIGTMMVLITSNAGMT